RVYLLVSLTAPGPSGSTEPTRLCRGCSHPPRRPPAQAASSFATLLRQRGDGRSFTSIRRSTVRRGARGRGPRVRVPAVLGCLLEDVVDEAAEREVALLQTDAVRLLRELGADELEARGVGRDETGEDDVVGGDRVHLLVFQGFGALAVDVEQDDLGRLVLEVLSDVLRRCRAGYRTYLLGTAA